MKGPRFSYSFSDANAYGFVFARTQTKDLDKLSSIEKGNDGIPESDARFQATIEVFFIHASGKFETAFVARAVSLPNVAINGQNDWKKMLSFI